MLLDEDEAIVQRCVSKDMSATILRKVTGSSLAEIRTNAQLDKVTSVLLNRRPILHIVVLFAADQRVRKYSEDVQEAFVRAGVHVYVQMELEGKQLRNCTTVPAFIRPEHLLEVIANSLADYLIVLGDRNMKNETCQARKNGKLVEMKVEERVQTMVQEYLQGKTRRDPLDLQMSAFTPDNALDLMQSFSGMRNLKDRLQRVQQGVDEVLLEPTEHESKNRAGKGGIGSNGKLTSKHTTNQNAVVRLHKDCIIQLRIIHLLPTVNEEGEFQRGLCLGPNVLPIGNGISQGLSKHLAAAFEEMLGMVEAVGAQLMEFGSSPVWEQYLKEWRGRRLGRGCAYNQASQDADCQLCHLNGWVSVSPINDADAAVLEKDTTASCTASTVDSAPSSATDSDASSLKGCVRQETSGGDAPPAPTKRVTIIVPPAPQRPSTVRNGFASHAPPVVAMRAHQPRQHPNGVLYNPELNTFEEPTHTQTAAAAAVTHLPHPSPHDASHSAPGLLPSPPELSLPFPPPPTAPSKASPITTSKSFAEEWPTPNAVLAKSRKAAAPQIKILTSAHKKGPGLAGAPPPPAPPLDAAGPPGLPGAAYENSPPPDHLSQPALRPGLASMDKGLLMNVPQPHPKQASRNSIPDNVPIGLLSSAPETEKAGGFDAGGPNKPLLPASPQRTLTPPPRLGSAPLPTNPILHPPPPPLPQRAPAPVFNSHPLPPQQQPYQPPYKAPGSTNGPGPGLLGNPQPSYHQPAMPPPFPNRGLIPRGPPVPPNQHPQMHLYPNQPTSNHNGHTPPQRPPSAPPPPTPSLPAFPPAPQPYTPPSRNPALPHPPYRHPPPPPPPPHHMPPAIPAHSHQHHPHQHLHQHHPHPHPHEPFHSGIPDPMLHDAYRPPMVGDHGVPMQDPYLTASSRHPLPMHHPAHNGGDDYGHGYGGNGHGGNGADYNPTPFPAGILGNPTQPPIGLLGPAPQALPLDPPAPPMPLGDMSLEGPKYGSVPDPWSVPPPPHPAQYGGHPHDPMAHYPALHSHPWMPPSPASQSGSSWNLNPNALPFAPRGASGSEDELEEPDNDLFPVLINDDGSQCLIEDFHNPRKMAKAGEDGQATQPCAFCGKEATLECSNCVNLQRRGYYVPPTFFCCVEHQQKVWKQHHEEVHLKYAARKLQNGGGGAGGEARATAN